jgi:hypothetical protein
MDAIVIGEEPLVGTRRQTGADFRSQLRADCLVEERQPVAKPIKPRELPQLVLEAPLTFRMMAQDGNVGRPLHQPYRVQPPCPRIRLQRDDR